MFTPPQILRRQMTIYPIIGGIAVVALWLAYLLAAAFGIDLIFGQGEGAHATWYLMFAVLATIAIPLVLLQQLRLTLNLIRRGISAQGVVVKISSIQQNSQQHVTVAYSVKGIQYTAAGYANVQTLNQYTPKTRVPVIYDPLDPAKSQVFPNHALAAQPVVPEEPFAAQLSGVLTERFITAGLVLGQMILLLGILGLMGKPYVTGAGGPAVLAALALTLFEVMMWEKFRGHSGPGYEANLSLRKKIIMVLAVIALLWGPWAIHSASQEIQTTSQQADERAAERAKLAQISKDAERYQEIIAARQRK